MMKKALLSLLYIAVLVMLLPVSGMTAQAAITESGKWGDNLTWTLDSDGTLTIIGTGKMNDFEYSDDSAWMKYDALIKNVSIGDNVTGIGENAFSGCSALTSVMLPDSITSIGDYAFLDTVIKNLSTAGYIENVNSVVRSLVSREQVQKNDSAEIVKRRFSGSLPRFVATFISSEGMTKEEAEKIKNMLDNYISE